MSRIPLPPLPPPSPAPCQSVILPWMDAVSRFMSLDRHLSKRAATEIWRAQLKDNVSRMCWRRVWLEKQIPGKEVALVLWHTCKYSLSCLENKWDTQQNTCQHLYKSFLFFWLLKSHRGYRYRSLGGARWGPHVKIANPIDFPCRWSLALPTLTYFKSYQYPLLFHGHGNPIQKVLCPSTSYTQHSTEGHCHSWLRK